MSIPLSLYIHIPWCVQKCPYCDFNSHPLKTASVPEKDYIARLLLDIQDDIRRFAIDRPLNSIFIGGGTPSLFSGSGIRQILDGIRTQIDMTSNIEITLEANPGTVDEAHFRDYFRAGINRLSVGIQSFNAEQLQRLGRIHNPIDAERAVKTAQDIGFNNLNIDIMFGLPEQTATQAMIDIEKGIALNTEHLSYYQLTLEPNTAFAHRPPLLPEEEHIDTRFKMASQRLVADNFCRYEVSAWSRGRQARHNLNYWEHGDYLGIGAGAHGKITLEENGAKHIIRTTKPRSPKAYLQQPSTPLSIAPEFRSERIVPESDKAFEFMLNTLRLANGFERRLMLERGLFSEQSVMPILKGFAQKELLNIDTKYIRPTELGYRFVNEMVEKFI